MSTLTPEQTTWFAGVFGNLVANIEAAVLGKTETVQLAVACLLTGGHLLLEDVPGTGKTMLAKAMAATVHGTNSRIQFTPDLLPSDVTGGNIFNQQTSAFEFHPGPIFASIVLADEINRASPKTQAALLEVMEESRVTVDGRSYPVGPTFMVIATQNPIEQAGTYPLPEAQLDRFLMRTGFGYPSHDTSVRLLAEASNRNRAAGLAAVITPKGLVEMSTLADQVHVESSLLSYITRLAEATRDHDDTTLGASMRGCLSFVRVAKTWALAHGRSFVIPDDVKQLAEPVLAHRLAVRPEAEFEGRTTNDVVRDVLASVEPPARRLV